MAREEAACTSSLRNPFSPMAQPNQRGFPLSRQASKPERTAQPPATHEAPDPPAPHGLQPSGSFLGYLNAYPDHWTQGDDLEDLKDQLLDLYQEFPKNELT